MSILADNNLSLDSWAIKESELANSLLANPLLKKDVWHTINDLGLQTNQHERVLTISFKSIRQDWLKTTSKLYVIVRSNRKLSAAYIQDEVQYLSRFSQFIEQKSIFRVEQINAQLFDEYDYYLKSLKLSPKTITHQYTTLNNFFNYCRDEGWLRPSELALLKQDCLVQEGQNWKLVWHRKKTNDYHEIPITITIAKVVQQQQKYIGNLWGNEWDYLFCHYYNLSNTDPSQSNLKPIKKILPSQVRHPLSTGICTLIKALDIRDENGQPAKFTPQLLRSTRLTELFDQGHDLSVVSAWAGHKHFVTTSTYYTEVSCDLMQREAGHIHQALVNSDGNRISYESFPKSFWDNPVAHKLEVGATHINTPIYGYCGLPLDQDCHKFRACYTCRSFAATIEKLPQYINILNELRAKSVKAMSAGQEVLVEQFGRQVEQLDKIIASLQQEAA